jgi:hypothetical protein
MSQFGSDHLCRPRNLMIIFAREFGFQPHSKTAAQNCAFLLWSEQFSKRGTDFLLTTSIN